MPDGNIGITIYFVFVSAVFGACMGSFLNCLAWRTVHGESVLKGRSHCDFCGHVLGFRDLVPIFSFVFSGGKCHYCGKKLSPAHVWREALSCAVFAFIFLRFGISLKVIEGFVFASVLLACAFADLEEYIIPDSFIIFGSAARIVFVLISGDVLAEAISSVLGGLIIGGALLAVVLIFEKLRKKEAMGGGDIKMIFMTGLYLGLWRNLLCVFLAAVFGIIFGMVSISRQEKDENAKLIPWGPSIALSALLVFLFGEMFINWYAGLLV